jgi:hypothetical protein
MFGHVVGRGSWALLILPSLDAGGRYTLEVPRLALRGGRVGIQAIPSQSPFGFNGRTIYLRPAWTF